MSIRVLVVDDSAFARKVIREALESDPALEVVGVARDGLEALEKIAELEPDVVTLDLVMPNLDGLGVLLALPLARHAPRVVVVSIADDSSALGIKALQAGAIDLVHKPTAQATARLHELGAELREKVKLAAVARVVAPLPATTPAPDLARRPTARRLVVIGTSTGGPQALSHLLRDLPADFPVPIAIVVHMPVEYTRAFAERLDEDCALEVREAEEGMVLAPGRVIVARGGKQLTIDEVEGMFVARLGRGPADTLHNPSVDVLFGSVASHGAAVLAVVLTGMGDDGLAGAHKLALAGGEIITESETSCVIYGMPRVIKEAGLSTAEAPLATMASLILRHL